MAMRPQQNTLFQQGSFPLSGETDKKISLVVEFRGRNEVLKVPSSLKIEALQSYVASVLSLSFPVSLVYRRRMLEATYIGQKVGDTLVAGDRITVVEEAPMIRRNLYDMNPTEQVQPPTRNPSSERTPITPFPGNLTINTRKDMTKEEVQAATLRSLNETKPSNQFQHNPPMDSTTSPAGDPVATGSFSQFSLRGGSSACTVICLIAALHFLSRDVATASGSDIDEILLEGISLSEGMDYQCDVPSLWSSAEFSAILGDLLLGPTHSKVLDHAGGFHDALRHALDHERSCGIISNVALVMRKSGESILALFQRGRWYLFSSHGQRRHNKNAYIESFPSLGALASAIKAIFPYQDFGGSPHSAIYNSYEAFPLVWIARSPSKPKSIVEATVAVADDPPLVKHQNNTLPVAEPVHELAQATAVTTPIDTPDTPDVSNQARAAELPSFLSEEDFIDPIILVVMADPVTCDDGYTYERSVIEKHFQTRIEAEEKRQEEEERQRRGEQDEDQDATCCGNRPPIQLISPMSGEVVSAKLVPNRQVEQQIVRVVESNVLDMSQEDIDDWKRRREEKVINDRRRQEEKRREEERQEQMKRNAEAAERRRQEERDQVPAGQQVRLLRNPRSTREKLTDNDTGLAVALCKGSDYVDARFLTEDTNGMRCMMVCCATELETHFWCKRCGRILCSDCTDFGVTDITEPDSTRVHNICIECLSDVLDKINSQDVRTKQARAIIRKMRVERHLSTLAEQAASQQDNVVRDQSLQQFRPQIEELRSRIESLRSEETALKGRIERANADAEQARTDTVPGAIAATTATSTAALEEIDRLQAECRRLQKEIESLRQQTPTDGDAINHIARLEELDRQFDECQMKLVGALSTPQDATPSSGSVEELEAKCARLQVREQQILSSDNNNRLELSAVQAELEQAQMDLITARSTELSSGEVAGTSEPGLDAVHALIQKMDMQPRRNQGALFRFMRARTSKAARQDLTAVVEELNNTLKQYTDLCAATQLSVHTQDHVRRTVAAELLRERIVQIPKNTKTVLAASVDAAIAAIDSHSKFHAKDLNSNSNSTKSTHDGQRKDPDIELAFLRSLDMSSMEDSEIQARVMRISQLESILLGELEDGHKPAARPSASQRQSPQSHLEPQDVSVERARLAAIGTTYSEWPLPMDLKYPTEQMQRQLELLRNSLRLQMLQSQRKWETVYTRIVHDLTATRNNLEDSIASLEQESQQAEATAETERQRSEERRRRREEERRREEAARHERERIRQEQERAAREQRQRLEAEEEESRQLFARAASQQEGTASMLGGERGDLRMCGRCKAGPILNDYCSDLEAHNNSSTEYHGIVMRKDKPNHCPNCDWFDPNWHNWPYWDGIHGPH